MASTSKDNKTGAKRSATPPPNTTSPFLVPTGRAKKAKAIPRRATDVLNNGTVDLKTLKSYKQGKNETGTLKAAIAALSPAMPAHEMIIKFRRRFVLIDMTGFMTGVCYFDNWEIAVGDVLTIQDFRVEMGRLILHNTSTAGR